MTFGVVMKIFGKFAYLFIVSLLMGLGFGLLSALLLKKYNVSTYPQVLLFASQSLESEPNTMMQSLLSAHIGCCRHIP